MNFNAGISLSPPAKRPQSALGLSGLIFDCDGVLFDSKEANTAYYNHIRYAVHLPPMTEEEAAYSHMAATDEAIRRMIPPDLLEAALEARNSITYRDNFMAMMQPAPHMFSFLHAMHRGGMRLALCTNRSDSVHEVLRHFGLDSFFSPVITISNAQPKPDPQGLLSIVEQWEMSKDSVVFIGDSFVDQQAAARAGVMFWSFKNPGLMAEVTLSGFKELSEIADSLIDSSRE